MSISKRKITDRRIKDRIRHYRELEKRLFLLESGKNDMAYSEKKIMVVEDNFSNAQIAKEILKSMGFYVDHAENGLEAVKLHENKPSDYYDLILMDIVMPIMDGFEAAAILRGELGVQAKIIAFTATIPDDRSAEENKNYIDGYLLKPFQASSFKSIVWKYLHLGDKHVR